MRKINYAIFFCTTLTAFARGEVYIIFYHFLSCMLSQICMFYKHASQFIVVAFQFNLMINRKDRKDDKYI